MTPDQALVALAAIQSITETAEDIIPAQNATRPYVAEIEPQPAETSVNGPIDIRASGAGTDEACPAGLKGPALHPATNTGGSHVADQVTNISQKSHSGQSTAPVREHQDLAGAPMIMPDIPEFLRRSA